MEILLAALKEMLFHFAIWSFALLLLWINNRQVRRIDHGWIAMWEQKRNAPINTFVRSWTKVIKLLTFLKWALMISTFLVLAWNWSILQFFLSNRGLDVPRWVRDGGILLIKTLMFFLFVTVFIFLVSRVLRHQLLRVCQLARGDQTS